MRLIQTCPLGADLVAFHPIRFWNAQSIPAIASVKNQRKSAPYWVVDFKTWGFLVSRGIKRSKYSRIDEYFNKGWAKIRLFKTGSDESHHLKLTGLEPVTISLAAFIRRILCSFWKGVSLPANSHFILRKTRRQKFLWTYKFEFFVFHEVANRRHTRVCQGLRRCETKKVHL